MAKAPKGRCALDNVEEFVLGRQGAQLLYDKIEQLPPRYGLYPEMACIGKYRPENGRDRRQSDTSVYSELP